MAKDKPETGTNAASGPKRGPGKPFTGKDDPRRSNAGQRSSAAVAFSASIRQQIVAIGEETAGMKDGREISRIEAVVRRVYQQAIDGNQDARDFIVDRTEGKVPINQIIESNAPLAMIALSVDQYRELAQNDPTEAVRAYRAKVGGG